MQWISIKDRLPEKDVEVLLGYWDEVYHSKRVFFNTTMGSRDGDILEYGEGWSPYDGTGYFERDKITHWCPIPESPPK